MFCAKVAKVVNRCIPLDHNKKNNSIQIELWKRTITYFLIVNPLLYTLICLVKKYWFNWSNVETGWSDISLEIFVCDRDSNKELTSYFSISWMSITDVLYHSCYTLNWEKNTVADSRNPNSAFLSLLLLKIL